MKGMIPRSVRLLRSEAEAQGYRHLFLQILKPLAADFEVAAGQFFMLGLPGMGESAFTYLSRPDHEGCFQALIRQAGSNSAQLCHAAAGSLLGYRGPYGHGWPLLYGRQDVLLVAGGCGLAPMTALINETLRGRPDVRLRLLYATRNPQLQVLAQQRQHWDGRFAVQHCLDCEGDDPIEQVASLCTRSLPDLVLCCGPELFMRAVGEQCIECGVPAASIWLSVERRMHCAIGLCGHCHVGDTFACTDGPTYRYDRYRELLEGNGCLLPV